jgi:hypothetical protein
MNNLLEDFEATLAIFELNADAIDAFVDQGFNNVKELMLVSKTQIKSILKYLRTVEDIQIKAMAEVCIYTLQLWASEKIKQGVALDVNEFTDEVCTLYMGRVRKLAEKEECRFTSPRTRCLLAMKSS